MKTIRRTYFIIDRGGLIIQVHPVRGSGMPGLWEAYAFMLPFVKPEFSNGVYVDV
jgi:hypothetical protein